LQKIGPDMPVQATEKGSGPVKPADGKPAAAPAAADPAAASPDAAAPAQAPAGTDAQ